MGIAAATLVVVALTAFVMNFFAGVDGRCSEEGWSGCGWIWQLSGWIVPACVAGLIASESPPSSADSPAER